MRSPSSKPARLTTGTTITLPRIRSRIHVFDEVEQSEGADNFATVDGALHQECGTRLRPSHEVYRYVQLQSGARRRRFKITECFFSGLCRNIADS